MLRSLFLALAAVISLCGCGNSASESARHPVENSASKGWGDNLPRPSADVDSMVTRFMRQWGIKGMTMAATLSDSLLYAAGYGWASEEDRQKMEPETIMRIASVSKLITAVAIMKLVDDGKLRLDRRVFGSGGILDEPTYTAAVGDPRLFAITVDHLLLHTGGFSRRAGDPMFRVLDFMKAEGMTRAPSPREMVKIVIGRRLAFEPGVYRHYSNFGYMLLSMIIEKVSGMNYWDYVIQEVLAPAGITDFRPAGNYLADRRENEARYYAPDSSLVEEFTGSGRMVSRVYGGNDIHGLMGAGGWLASAPGLARLVAAIDKDSRVPDILSARSIDKITEFSSGQKLARGWSDTDSLGTWTRTGTLSSTHALVRRYPDGKCLVFITNTGSWRGFHFARQLELLADKLHNLQI